MKIAVLLALCTSLCIAMLVPHAAPNKSKALLRMEAFLRRARQRRHTHVDAPRQHYMETILSPEEGDRQLLAN